MPGGEDRFFSLTATSFCTMGLIGARQVSLGLDRRPKDGGCALSRLSHPRQGETKSVGANMDIRTARNYHVSHCHDPSPCSCRQDQRQRPTLYYPARSPRGPGTSRLELRRLD